MADLLSATATMPEQLTATAEQLTATAEQQTSILYPQPYAPDKQGPADFQKHVLDPDGPGNYPKSQTSQN